MGDGDSVISRRRVLMTGAAAFVAAGAAVLMLPDVVATTLSGITGDSQCRQPDRAIRTVVVPRPDRAVVVRPRRACLATSGTSWFKIRRGDLMGWVASQYITLKRVVKVTTIERGRTDRQMRR